MARPTIEQLEAMYERHFQQAIHDLDYDPIKANEQAMGYWSEQMRLNLPDELRPKRKGRKAKPKELPVNPHDVARERFIAEVGAAEAKRYDSVQAGLTALREGNRRALYAAVQSRGVLADLVRDTLDRPDMLRNLLSVTAGKVDESDVADDTAKRYDALYTAADRVANGATIPDPSPNPAAGLRALLKWCSGTADGVKKITAQRAADTYQVTAKHLYRLADQGALTDHREEGHATNAPLLLDEDEVAGRFPKQS